MWIIADDANRTSLRARSSSHTYPREGENVTLQGLLAQVRELRKSRLTVASPVYLRVRSDNAVPDVCLDWESFPKIGPRLRERDARSLILSDIRNRPFERQAISSH